MRHPGNRLTYAAIGQNADRNNLLKTRLGTARTYRHRLQLHRERVRRERDQGCRGSVRGALAVFPALSQLAGAIFIPGRLGDSRSFCCLTEYTSQITCPWCVAQ